MMKMIQTLGYRVGICSVWHPRFKSVHKHRKCINVLFLLRTSTSQRSTRRRCTSATSTNCVTCICRQRTTQVQQNQSLVDTSRTCDKRQADALWASCLSAEAAFTLLLYWELLHWDERPLKEFLHYPAQTEWHRKEGLCRKVIHYFNKGKVRA